MGQGHSIPWQYCPPLRIKLPRAALSRSSKTSVALEPIQSFQFELLARRDRHQRTTPIQTYNHCLHPSHSTFSSIKFRLAHIITIIIVIMPALPFNSSAASSAASSPTLSPTMTPSIVLHPASGIFDQSY
ncbi:hypothetical protein ACJBU6_06226 [Exserohilum turcicum]